MKASKAEHGKLNPNPGNLENVRLEIDRVDEQLLDLLAQRQQQVHRVAELKSGESDGAIRDPQRELLRARAWADGAESRGLSSYYVERVLAEILDHSRRVQETQLDDRPKEERAVKLGFQGQTGCYSDLCASKLMATRGIQISQRRGYESFVKVVAALKSGEIDCALLPVENSICGSITEVNHQLSRGDLYIVDEEYWEVDHVLAAKPGAGIKEITTIRSHPAALAQCEDYLLMQGLDTQSWYDTAGAAESVAKSDDRSLAAICSASSALAWGLEIIDTKVADDERNLTRFVLVANEAEQPSPRVPHKISLRLTLNHHQGALARCLTVFDRAGVSLTRIESRPQPGRPWEYQFFIDLMAPPAGSDLDTLWSELRQSCRTLRELGRYPSRSKLRVAAPAAPIPSDLDLGSRIQVEEKGHSVQVGDRTIGRKNFTLILGPCAVESRDQIELAAAMVKRRGAHLLRGGAFKPRTSPHSFQGLGEEGLRYLRDAGRAQGLPVVSELMHTGDLEAMLASTDMIQVGARNMQNFALLKALGKVDRPVLLKRGLSATVAELLAAAEYITSGGNHQVILCERGIRTFETATRSTLDVAAITILKERSPFPVIVDPSHAAGRRELVVPLALAAVAAGADGLIVEAHPDPDAALCDKEQALRDEDLIELIRGLDPILAARGLSR